MAVAVGEISYTNIWPLYYYLDRARLKQLGCSFIPHVPAQLNHAMATGVIDVGGISSFAYAENVDRYQLLPDLAVASKKQVGSIFLFSKVPITDLHEKKIALTSSSATSVNLLKIILKNFYDIDVNYSVQAPNFGEMMATHDACLLIGDDAILTLWRKARGYYRYDMGELWYEHTGYPMTYAVFAVRNEVLANERDVIEALHQEFIHSKQKSEREHYQPMIAKIRNDFGGERSFWETYFSGLTHDLDEKQLEGLLYYYKLAYQQGLLKKQVQSISLWSAHGKCHSIL
ncbi:menaquinone biosynthesis protein [Desertibacillus haloalkaliphilus]|uniref:menaquinone biosynthesis protein n=1 Tax=Desertibacillus haloalkaliphilus TaxID=1328930 RepID=UPI001C273BEE|nr:menaquinone biosynthesis protein [Desertibacillus haloalkaliphilus]MBU8907242.1 menaquinone biosynthesis protein [Desertibacillus haloalkaliphilus]